MQKLNNKYDNTKSFDEAVVSGTRGTYLCDSDFSQAIDEFGIEEEYAMDLLANSINYNFRRCEDGWEIELKD